MTSNTNEYKIYEFTFFQRDRSSLDLLNSIEEDQIPDDQHEIFDQLKEALISTSANPQID